MKSAVEEFIEQINFVELSKQLKNKKIVIWGASEAGALLHSILKKNKIEVALFLDSNTLKTDGMYDELEIHSPDILKNNKNEYYIFLAMNYSKEVEEYLIANSYKQIDDYYFIFNKNEYIKVHGEYKDEYKNIISGPKGTRINFVGYNSELIIGKNVDLGKNVSIYSINSKIYICDNVKIENDVTIWCLKNSKLYINEDTIIRKNSHLYCVDNSDLNIGKRCVIGLKNEVAISSVDKSSMTIGDNNHIADMSDITCESNGNLTIKEDCTFEKGLFLFSKFGGKISIGKDCMFSSNVTIANNDGHAIFDVNTGKRVNGNQSIVIGNHVWVGNKCTVLSKSNIMDGSIIGANSLVNGVFPNNCIIVGNPAVIKRKDIAWDREAIEFREIKEKKYWLNTQNINLI